MTSGHPPGSPEFPEQLPTHSPRHMAHKSELSDAREIIALESKISDLLARAGQLGMVDDYAVFHSTIDEGDRVSVASEVVQRTSMYAGYLRIVTNRHIRVDDYTDDGLIFASDNLIGLSERAKNISTGVGVMVVRDSSALQTYDAEYPTPPYITKNTQFEYMIYRFDNTPTLSYPLPATIYSLPAVIADKMASAEHVSRALDMLTVATEDARYPLYSQE